MRLRQFKLIPAFGIKFVYEFEERRLTWFSSDWPGIIGEESVRLWLINSAIVSLPFWITLASSPLAPCGDVGKIPAAIKLQKKRPNLANPHFAGATCTQRNTQGSSPSSPPSAHSQRTKHQDYEVSQCDATETQLPLPEWIAIQSVLTWGQRMSAGNLPPHCMSAAHSEGVLEYAPVQNRH
jgi:hypothetical protein